jgi:hypothetical protein
MRTEGLLLVCLVEVAILDLVFGHDPAIRCGLRERDAPATRTNESIGKERVGGVESKLLYDRFPQLDASRIDAGG